MAAVNPAQFQWMAMQGMQGGYDPAMMQQAANMMATFQQQQGQFANPGAAAQMYHPSMTMPGTAQAMPTMGAGMMMPNTMQGAAMPQAPVAVPENTQGQNQQAGGGNHQFSQCVEALSQVEREYYGFLWGTAGCANSQSLQGKAAFDFLSKSQLPKEILKRIWDLADWQKRHCLGWEEFVVTMKLISAAQRNQLVSLERVLENSSPTSMDCPTFQGIPNASTFKTMTAGAPESSSQGGAGLDQLVPSMETSPAPAPAAAPAEMPPPAAPVKEAPALDLMAEDNSMMTAAPQPPQPLAASSMPVDGGFEGVGTATGMATGIATGMATSAAAPATTAPAVQADSMAWAEFPSSSPAPASAPVTSSPPSDGWADFAPAAPAVPAAASGAASGAANDAAWADFEAAPVVPDAAASFGAPGSAPQSSAPSGPPQGDLWSKMSAFDDLMKEDDALGGSAAAAGLAEAFSAEASVMEPPPLVNPSSLAATPANPTDLFQVEAKADDDWGDFAAADTAPPVAPATISADLGAGASGNDTGNDLMWSAFGDEDQSPPQNDAATEKRPEVATVDMGPTSVSTNWGTGAGNDTDMMGSWSAFGDENQVPEQRVDETAFGAAPAATGLADAFAGDAFAGDAFAGDAFAGDAFATEPATEKPAPVDPFVGAAPSSNATDFFQAETKADDDWGDFAAADTGPPAALTTASTDLGAAATGNDTVNTMGSWSAFGDEDQMPASKDPVVGQPESVQAAVPKLPPMDMFGSATSFAASPAPEQVEDQSCCDHELFTVAKTLAVLGHFEEAEQCWSNAQTAKLLDVAENKKKEAAAKDDFEGAISSREEIKKLTAQLAAPHVVDTWKKHAASGNRDSGLDAAIERLRQRCQYLDDAFTGAALCVAIANFRNTWPATGSSAAPVGDMASLKNLAQRRRQAQVMSRAIEAVISRNISHYLQVLLISLGCVEDVLTTCQDQLTQIGQPDWTPEDRALVLEAPEFQDFLSGLSGVQRIMGRLSWAAELFLPGGCDSSEAMDTAAAVAAASGVVDVADIQAADTEKLEGLHSRLRSKVTTVRRAWSAIEAGLRGHQVQLKTWKPEESYELPGGSGGPICAFCLLPCTAGSDDSVMFKGGFWHVQLANFWVMNVATSKAFKEMGVADPFAQASC